MLYNVIICFKVRLCSLCVFINDHIVDTKCFIILSNEKCYIIKISTNIVSLNIRFSSKLDLDLMIIDDNL